MHQRTSAVLLGLTASSSLQISISITAIASVIMREAVLRTSVSVQPRQGSVVVVFFEGGAQVGEFGEGLIFAGGK